MNGNSNMELPAAGLAEEILAGFVNAAQAQADRQAQQPVEEQSQIFHLVTFGLAGERYGVAIERVQEIIRAAGVTPVPGAPRHVCGVINLRGRIIPVVDLRRRFGLPDLPGDDRQRIVVVELGAKTLGMLVDSVSQVIRVPAAQVEALPEQAAVEEKYLRGVGKLEDGLVFIMDLEGSLLAGYR